MKAHARKHSIQNTIDISMERGVGVQNKNLLKMLKRGQRTSLHKIKYSTLSPKGMKTPCLHFEGQIGDFREYPITRDSGNQRCVWSLGEQTKH